MRGKRYRGQVQGYEVFAHSVSSIFGFAGRAKAWPAIAALALILTGTAAASEAIASNRGVTGLPLPRYVSLKSERVNMRVGPGREYQVEWLYLKRGLPMEIIQEYDNWRKVRDPEGNEGWILHSLLSGSRTVIVAPWDIGRDLIEMREQPQPGSRIVARIEPSVVATVDICVQGWCRLAVSGTTGYVRQNRLWGVYPDEQLSD